MHVALALLALALGPAAVAVPLSGDENDARLVECPAAAAAAAAAVNDPDAPPPGRRAAVRPREEEEEEEEPETSTECDSLLEKLRALIDIRELERYLWNDVLQLPIRQIQCEKYEAQDLFDLNMLPTRFDSEEILGQMLFSYEWAVRKAREREGEEPDALPSGVHAPIPDTFSPHSFDDVEEDDDDDEEEDEEEEEEEEAEEGAKLVAEKRELGAVGRSATTLFRGPDIVTRIPGLMDRISKLSEDKGGDYEVVKVIEVRHVVYMPGPAIVGREEETGSVPVPVPVTTQVFTIVVQVGETGPRGGTTASQTLFHSDHIRPTGIKTVEIPFPVLNSTTDIGIMPT